MQYLFFFIFLFFSFLCKTDAFLPLLNLINQVFSAYGSVVKLQELSEKFT